MYTMTTPSPKRPPKPFSSTTPYTKNDAVLTESEVRQIAAAAASQAVVETLVRLGLDTASPMEMQRDMQHLRDWRKTTERIQSHSLLTIVGIIVTGLVGLVVVGLLRHLKG